jgi:hypothetical protein
MVIIFRKSRTEKKREGNKGRRNEKKHKSQQITMKALRL